MRHMPETWIILEKKKQKENKDIQEVSFNQHNRKLEEFNLWVFGSPKTNSNHRELVRLSSKL